MEIHQKQKKGMEQISPRSCQKKATQPTVSWSWLQLLEVWDNKFLLSNPPSLLHFVMAALAVQQQSTDGSINFSTFESLCLGYLFVFPKEPEWVIDKAGWEPYSKVHAAGHCGFHFLSSF